MSTVHYNSDGSVRSVSGPSNPNSKLGKQTAAQLAKQGGAPTGGTSSFDSAGNNYETPTATKVRDKSGNISPLGFGEDVESATSAITGRPNIPTEDGSSTAVSPEQTGMLSYQQAQQNLNTGGLTGSDLASAQNNLANKYQVAHTNATASGVPAPSDPGQAMAQGSSFIPKSPQDTTAVDTLFSEDPAINTLMSGITQLLNPQKQTTTLMQDYKKLYKESGLKDINEELIDADTVINGTEDDIRNEIQTAGGFGTESQVQAMSLARNKGLLKRYNQLVQMKTDATNQLNTLSQLNAEDKQMAQTKLNSQISNMFSLANFRQQAQNNVKEQYRWLTTTMGADGIYDAYKSDPRQLSFLEKTLGVAPGGLASLATKARQDRALEQAYKQAQTANIYSEINERNAKNSTTTTTQQLATTQSNIQQVSGLLTSKGLGSSVGPNLLARINPLNVFTGEKQNFISGVEQLRSQLNLDTLIKAKGQGATFGALSDQELKVLSSAGTKLGTWAVKDKAGNITGYNSNEKDFRAEMDKINNFAKLDYVLKGGDPVGAGIDQLPDGSYWSKNSDGTYTRIK